MRSRKRRYWLWVGIPAVMLIALLSLCLGNSHFTPAELMSTVFSNFGADAGMSAGGETGGDAAAAAAALRMRRNILLYARMPRTIACLLAGAALAVSGAVLQNVLANRLAAPSIIGVNAGAGLGVTLCCAAGVLSGWGISAGAFCGSLLTVTLIFFFSRRTGASKTTVILGGVALNAVLNAVCESIAVLDTDVAMLSVDFRVGGFSAVSYARLLPAGVLILIALCILFTLCNELDVITLGDETAQGVGMNVRKYRMIFLFLAALLAGAAVSFSGLLGFVGLIVPHFVRRFAGNESRNLLPCAAISGAGFLTFCDLTTRLLFAPYELPVGILMAAIGGPVFILLLVRFKGGHRYD